jgi:hypothetical protein
MYRLMDDTEEDEARKAQGKESNPPHRIYNLASPTGNETDLCMVAFLPLIFLLSFHV